jgi:RimJ/RimL family protein N-acetyltransferase
MIGDPAAVGHGLAKEATRLLIAHGHSRLGLKEIYLEVLKDNVPAIAIYRATGFEIAGEREEAYQMRVTWLA